VGRSFEQCFIELSGRHSLAAVGKLLFADY